MFLKCLLHNFGKVDIDLGFDKFESYVDGLPEMKVIINRMSAFNEKYDEVLIEKCKLTWFGRELHFGDHLLNFRYDASKDTKVYKNGNSFIISIPRGYDGDRTYYTFKPAE